MWIHKKQHRKARRKIILDLPLHRPPWLGDAEWINWFTQSPFSDPASDYESLSTKWVKIKNTINGSLPDIISFQEEIRDWRSSTFEIHE
jgi:hypothetical protein